MSFEERSFAGADGESLVKDYYNENENYGRDLAEGQQAS